MNIKNYPLNTQHKESTTIMTSHSRHMAYNKSATFNWYSISQYKALKIATDSLRVTIDPTIVRPPLPYEEMMKRIRKGF